MSKNNSEDSSEVQSSFLLNTSKNGVSCKSSPRRIYTREEMLKYKELEASKRDIDEESICSSSKVLCKILIPGCKVLEKFSKPQHDGGIVLGPQKRTWNTGCHVTQSKRSPNDSFIRGNRGPNGNKFVRGDFKRDNRGNGGRFSSGNNGNFNRSKEGAHFRGRASNSFNESEAEPEWFTEGPETVNDTVEFGMSIDEDGEFKPIEKTSPSDNVDTAIATTSTNPSIVDSAILSINKDLLLPGNEEASRGSEVTESDFLKLLSIPKKKTCEGSLVLKLLNDSKANRELPQNAPQAPVQDNTKFVIKFPVTDDDKLVATNSRHQSSINPSQPSPADLSSLFRDLVLRGNTSSLPLEVPRVSSKSSLLSSVPTVEQIEAAALANGKSGSFQNIPNPSHTPEQYRGRSILETLRLAENSPGLTRPQGFDSYNPPQSSMPNWSETSFNSSQGSNTTVNSSGDNYQFKDLFMRTEEQGCYNQPSQIPGRNLPNDPAIATAVPQGRGIPLNSARAEFEHSILAAQNRRRQQQQQFGNSQQQQQQYPFFPLHPNYRSGLSTANLHPSASVEAALGQMRGSFGVRQQQNTSTPPNSTFSSTTPLGSRNRNTQLEQYLQSAAQNRGGGNVLSPMMDNCMTQPQQHPLHLSQQYPPLRYNGSAPTLLPPTANSNDNPPTNNNSGGGFDMFLCNYDNSFVDPPYSRQRKKLS